MTREISVLRLMPACGAALLLALAAPAARAERPAPSTAATQRNAEALARDAHEKGKLHYNVGEFELALERFSEAYKLWPAPGLLFNIGQCHRQLGRPERAAFFFRGFLREAPEGDPNRPLVEELLKEAEAASRDRAAADGTVTSSADPSAEPSDGSTSSSVGSAIDPAAGESPPAEPEALWPWAAAGATVAAVAAGTAAVVGILMFSNRQPPQGSLGVIDLRATP